VVEGRLNEDMPRQTRSSARIRQNVYSHDFVALNLSIESLLELAMEGGQPGQFISFTIHPELTNENPGQVVLNADYIDFDQIKDMEDLDPPQKGTILPLKNRPGSIWVSEDIHHVLGRLKSNGPRVFGDDLHI
jgi:hypothetical protein